MGVHPLLYLYLLCVGIWECCDIFRIVEKLRLESDSFFLGNILMTKRGTCLDKIFALH